MLLEWIGITECYFCVQSLVYVVVVGHIINGCWCHQMPTQLITVFASQQLQRKNTYIALTLIAKTGCACMKVTKRYYGKPLETVAKHILVNKTKRKWFLTCLGLRAYRLRLSLCSCLFVFHYLSNIMLFATNMAIRTRSALSTAMCFTALDCTLATTT